MSDGGKQSKLFAGWSVEADVVLLKTVISFLLTVRLPSDSSDPVEPPGPDGLPVRPAAEWSIKVESEEQEGDSFKEEEAAAAECDDKDRGWAPTGTEVMNEASPAETDGTLIVIQEDGGYSDRVMWLIQGYQNAAGTQDEKAPALNDEGTFAASSNRTWLR